MARDRSPIMKRARSLGVAPQMLGIQKKSNRNPAGRQRKKEGDYGRQMRAKQTAKFVYGVLERQFRNTYEDATKMPGKTGENLLILLELRLDNVVYRLGLADTRAQARQFVNHGLIDVNGRRASIPSMRLSEGDEVSVRENARKTKAFDNLPEVIVPEWLSSEQDHLKGRVLRAPTRDEIDLDVDETLIVELYSK